MNDFKLSFSLEGRTLSVPFYFVDDVSYTFVTYSLDKFRNGSDLILAVHRDEQRLSAIHEMQVFCMLSPLFLSEVV